MTALELQRDLKELLQEKVLKDALSKQVTGTKASPMGYLQNLPMQQTEEDLDPFPYFIVRVSEGEIESDEGPQDVTILLLFGTYDEERDNQGFKDILIMIEKVQQHFRRFPLLLNKYRIKPNMAWSLQEDEAAETYPYYFGGMELHFETAVVQKEDPYA